MIDHTEQAKIEYELDRILADEKFSAAPQMSAFLRYVVKQTLDGNSERIKAYTVAVDALGKPPTFDPQNDPSVRVLAKRLRSSIEQYYERTSGHEVIIEMTRGSYIPKFVPANRDDDRSDDTGASGGPGGSSMRVDDALRARLDTYTSSPAGDTDLPPGKLDAAAQDGTGAPAPENPTDDGSIDSRRIVNPGSLAALGTAPAQAPARASNVGVDSASPAPAGAATLSAQPTRSTTVNTNTHVNFPSSPREWLARGKLPRSLAFVGVAAMALWYMQQGGAPDMADVATVDAQRMLQDDPNLRIELASDTRVQPLTPRPQTPTINVLIDRDSNSLEARLGSHMASVISHFDNVQAMNDHRSTPGVQHYWPEEYALSISKLNVDDKLAVSVQLLHRSTGRIVHADRLMLDKTADTTLSSSEMASLDEFTARLVQQNGPLMRDYKSLGNQVGLMSCVFAVRDSDTGGGSCAETLSAEPLLKGRALALQAEQQLKVASGLHGKARSDAVSNAVKLAREAVKRSPYSANAHAVLMSGLAYQGDQKGAIDAANRALELNPFDGDILRAVARLVKSDDLKKSNELVERAERLSGVKNT